MILKLHENVWQAMSELARNIYWHNPNVKIVLFRLVPDHKGHRLEEKCRTIKELGTA